MVSFQCDGCGDTIKKPQLDKHRNRCWSTFSCIDCSTTFHGTDYKAHTSCISEAEKYQGALYKGKKGGQGGHAGNNSKPAQPAPQAAPTPAEPAAAEEPTPAPAAPAIHPSRSALLAGPEPGTKPRANRTGFPGLHPGANYPPPRVYGRPAREQQQRSTKNWATGMNGTTGGQMRSWGGSPAPEDVDPEKVAVNQKAVVDLVVPVPITVVGETEGDGEGKKKKKKRKGDKGGTGSRANSNALKKDAESAQPTTAGTTVELKTAEPTKSIAENGDAVKAVAEAPAVVIPAAPLASESTSSKSKKRKASDEADDSAESSKKTSKKLRKALSSLAATDKSVPLSTLIEKISAQVSKKKTGEVIDATGIARDIKVKFVDGAAGEEGKWVLEV
ncbi:hypothetical protein QFC20_005758 [Naganishia adeliensis]|uniref:Uncharacterized protein n=1 Tax=Naganishia adeliensis TaxID=92952 RepID=A0ACC2VKB2_9TREE|nr:hypothetical protein QFC20_005758 [Naganishia adeliensis]